MAEILDQLNKEQRLAVEAVEGPVMVIAGAGSGKTRVLTYRVAHLLNLGVDPFRVLALTFTNKAAREMKERIISLVGSTDAKNVWMGTFHSVFARVLRNEAARIGYPSNFTIYDTDDAKKLIRLIIKELSLDDKAYAPNYVLNRISAAKSSLITAEQYNASDDLTTQDKMANKPFIGQIYQVYKNRLFRSAAMDFDDLLLNTYLLFLKFPDVLMKYQRRFEFVLVDEYQDTNRAQYLIIKQLAANNENICVVGDDAQSIYSFRGANIQNILNFKKDYPDAHEFKLEQNYRSTKTIVKAANSIIANNKDQIFKEIWTDNDEGELIQLMQASSDNEEGALVAGSIFEQKMNKQEKNSAFAILYRTNAQSRSMEEALRRLNIPYRIYGGLSFYKRKEIKDLLAYFRLVVNNQDEDALRRVINYPARGIGKTTLEKASLVAGNNHISLWDVVKNPRKYALNVGSGIMGRMEGFVNKIQSFSIQLKEKNSYDLAKLIAESSGLLKDLNEDKTPEGINRVGNIEELLNAIKDYVENGAKIVPGTDEKSDDDGDEFRSLDLFLQEIALLTDADTNDKSDGDEVTLMTIHAAKGLEFPYVYLVGLEENLFPSIMALNSRADLEEERRLFYVAITRAEKKLFISYAENRYRWGNLTLCEPSRFLEELDDKFIDYPQRKAYETKAPVQMPTSISPPVLKNNMKKVTVAGSSIPFDSDLMNLIMPGVEVEHNRFGKGKVIGIEGNGSSKKAAVFFKTVGQKQLLLKYAKLKIIQSK